MRSARACGPQCRHYRLVFDPQVVDDPLSPRAVVPGPGRVAGRIAQSTVTYLQHLQLSC